MKRYSHCYMNQMAGAFVLITVLIAGVSLYMAGHAQRWFEKTVTFKLLLPEDGCYGLRAGAVVMVMGTKAGELTHIDIRDDNRMIAHLAVREDFTRFVGAGAHATIKKTLGMAGDAFVEISGRPGPPLPADALIETTVDRAITEMLEETLDQIRTELLPAIQMIRLAAENHAQVVAGLNQPEHPALKVLERINAIATKIDEGDGLVNRLLADKQMADDVNSVIDRAGLMLQETGAAASELRMVAVQIGKSAEAMHDTIEQFPETVNRVNTTLEDMRKISDNLIRITASLPDTIENVNDQVISLTGVIVQTQSTLREIQRLAEAAQRHWLVRGYIEGDEPHARISPQEVLVIP